MSAKDFFERFDRELREGMKHSITGEKAIGNEGMDVRVEIEVFAKSVEGQDDCGMRLFIPEGRSESDRQTLLSGGAEVFEKDPVPQEIGTEHFWQCQDVMPVRDRSEDALYDKGGGSLDVFLMAGRAEPAAFTGKSEESIEPAGVAMNSSEAAFEIPAIEEFMNNSLDNGTDGPLFGLVVFGITLPELSVMAVSALPER